MNKLLILLLLTVLSGCATYTPDEREARHAIAAENWMLCEMAYKGINRHTISYHDHRWNTRHTYFEVTDDLRVNFCRSVLGPYWITL